RPASSVLRWIGSESRRKRIRLRNQARVSPNSDFRNLPFGPKPVLRIDSIEESHENRNLFVGVLSLGKYSTTVTNGSAGANPTFRETASSPLQTGRRFPKEDPTHDKTVNDIKGRRIPERGNRSRWTSGIIWNHWKVTTQSRHAIHIRLQCPEDSILKANLVKLVNARYKQRV